jgi:hypothetical protein
MALVSVSAVYDGKQIRLLENAPVHEPYHVLVTFVEPAHEQEMLPQDRARFWASFGAWQEDVFHSSRDRIDGRTVVEEFENDR